MTITQAQHDTAHQMIDDAYAKWVERGRPRGRIQRDPGGLKRGARRKLGLILSAHIGSGHGMGDVFGPKSKVPKAGFAPTFAEAMEHHKKLHAEDITITETAEDLTAYKRAASPSRGRS